MMAGDVRERFAILERSGRCGESGSIPETLPPVIGGLRQSRIRPTLRQSRLPCTLRPHGAVSECPPHGSLSRRSLIIAGNRGPA